MPARLTLLLAFLLGALAAPASALELPAGFDVRQLAAGLDLPTAAVVAPDGRVFVTEKNGRLMVAEPDDPKVRVAADLTAQVNSHADRGLLGLALDADFAANRRLYLLYVAEAPGAGFDQPVATTSRLSYFEVAGDGSVGPEHVVLDGLPAEEWWHNIGTVRADPDGTLWVGTGDATTVPHARALEALDPDRLRGKILHVDREGNGLPDNPFCPGETTSPCSKVFAGGFRNPFRFQLREGGGLVVGDVGELLYDELSFVDAGELHGWPCWEGRTEAARPVYAGSATCALWRDPATRPAGASWPDLFYARATGAAVVAGPEYAGDAFPAAYVGSVFFGDYARGTVDRRLPDGSVVPFATGWQGVQLDASPDGQDLVSVEFGDWSASNAGVVNLITWSPDARTPTARAIADPSTGGDPLTVTLSGAESTDADGDSLSYRWEFGDGSPDATGAVVQHTYALPGRYTARLRVEDATGRRAWATVPILAGDRPQLQLGGAATFRLGLPVRLTASANDDEDGLLPPGQIAWQVLLHHDDHVHEYTRGTGRSLDFVHDPGHADNASHVYYEVRVTATDSDGLTTDATRDVLPEAAQVADTPASIPAPAADLQTGPLPDRAGPRLKVLRRGRTLAGHARDASGPVRVQARLSGKGKAWRNARVRGARWRMVLHGARPGRRAVRIRAIDAAGNRTTIVRTIRIRRR